MYPLFESVCVAGAAVQHGAYHEARFRASYEKLYEKNPGFSLWEGISLQGADPSLTYKLRIRYRETGTDWELAEYRSRLPETLRLVCDDSVSYSLKYSDRQALERLVAQRDGADDVLIVREGLVTDSSYCNILFWDGRIVTTPKRPLLEGTCRARLIRENHICEADVPAEGLHAYRGFQLVNALNDFDPGRWRPMEHILPQGASL